MCVFSKRKLWLGKRKCLLHFSLLLWQQSAAVLIDRQRTHTHLPLPTCYSTTIDSRFDGWEMWGECGYRATRPMGHTGCRGTLIPVTPLTCGVPFSGGSTISPSPSPLLYTNLLPGCPSSNADPQGQVNQIPGLGKNTDTLTVDLHRLLLECANLTIHE